jgi:hypothetical protein
MKPGVPFNRSRVDKRSTLPATCEGYRPKEWVSGKDWIVQISEFWRDNIHQRPISPQL